MTVTEVATITLVAGSDIADKDSEVAKICQSMCDTISRQPGFQGLYFGQELESPHVAQLFVNWDRLESHESFKGSPAYQPMLKSLEPIMAEPPLLVHFEFNAPGKLAAAVSAPVTELAMAFLDEKSSSFDSNMELFANVLAEHAQNSLGMAHGWSIEDVEQESTGAGGKGKACLLAIGWQSVDAHMAFKNTDAFQKSLGYFKEAKGVEIHHTNFQPTL